MLIVFIAPFQCHRIWAEHIRCWVSNAACQEQIENTYLRKITGRNRFPAAMFNCETKSKWTTWPVVCFPLCCTLKRTISTADLPKPTEPSSAPYTGKINLERRLPQSFLIPAAMRQRKGNGPVLPVFQWNLLVLHTHQEAFWVKRQMV